MVKDLSAHGAASAADLREGGQVGGDRRHAEQHGLGAERASGQGRGGARAGQHPGIEPGGDTQPTVPQQPEHIVQLIDDLQYPLHAGSISCS